MMNIIEIAQQEIIALGLIPEKNVMVTNNRPNWDGASRILITSEPTKPEDVIQSGIVSAETIFAIHSLAKDRQDAWDLVRKAAFAVYKKIEELEQQRGSGVLCITLVEHNLFQVPERSEYQAFVSFRILHSPLL
jgi:hypothetical protein